MHTILTFLQSKRYLHKEVNRTEPSPSASVPCYG